MQGPPAGRIPAHQDAFAIEQPRKTFSTPPSHSIAKRADIRTTKAGARNGQLLNQSNEPLCRGTVLCCRLNQAEPLANGWFFCFVFG